MLDNDKITVDFTDPMPSEYEIEQLLCFFRKYKREIFIEHEGTTINYIVTPWRYWVEFLLELGFADTAHAIGEILNDLEIDHAPTMDEYIDQLKHAKIIRGYEPKPPIQRDEEQYEKLKEQEVKKMVIKKYIHPPEKTASEISFERDTVKLSQYIGQWVAYLNGEFLGADEDKEILSDAIVFEKNIQPDLIKKIEEFVDKNDEPD